MDARAALTFGTTSAQTFPALTGRGVTAQLLYNHINALTLFWADLHGTLTDGGLLTSCSLDHNLLESEGKRPNPRLQCFMEVLL